VISPQEITLVQSIAVLKESHPAEKLLKRFLLADY